MKIIRPDLIRILNGVAECEEFPIHYAENATLDEIGLVAELMDQGLLCGSYVSNEVGRPCHVVVLGITLSGREYVSNLKDSQTKESTSGKTFLVLKYICIFLLGVLGTLLTQWLSKLLGLT